MKKSILAILCILPLISTAAENGFAISYGNLLGSTLSTPDGMRGVNLAYTLQPKAWTWNHFAILLNASYGHWSTSWYTENSAINTYAIAPVLRWFIFQNSKATPFLTGSIGATYLSNTLIGDRDLGTHFAFQDQAGMGLAFGAAQNFYTTLQYFHYSNASLAKNNGGMSIPLVLTVGCQF